MYVVAYDITNNKERKKIADILNNYGERVQKSVFVCDIKFNTFDKLKNQLERQTIKTGNVHIWLTQSPPWKIGAEETMPEKKWVHCL